MGAQPVSRPRATVVVFDTSGSMGGPPIEAAHAHALAAHGPKTPWRTSDGTRILAGLLGDADALARLSRYMGGQSIETSIDAACAPGVRIVVYTDEVDGRDDPLKILDGLTSTVVIVHGTTEMVAKGCRTHPSIDYEILRLPS